MSHVRASGLASSLTQQLVGQTDDRTHDGYTYAIEGTEALIREAMARAFAAEGDDT